MLNLSKEINRKYVLNCRKYLDFFYIIELTRTPDVNTFSINQRNDLALNLSSKHFVISIHFH